MPTFTRHFTSRAPEIEFKTFDGPPFPVAAPATWSTTAVQVAATKYLRGTERDVRELFGRVVKVIVAAGRARGDFDDEQARVFGDELTHVLLTQRASFNSPVYFNVGLRESPQASACFIQSLRGDQESIFELLRNEAKLFSYGSGTGTNFSNVRENLIPSLEIFDKAAQAIRSGGIDRRAAKMVILDAEHPAALEFVRWKVGEERKANLLIRAGVAGGMDGEALRTVSGQNSNNSVRVTDAFMRAARAGAPREAELLREMARAAWECADPGVQFHDTIQAWHTCPSAGAIRASNPCGEFIFLDDSACNLASLNLVSFLNSRPGRPPEFDWASFRHVARLMLVAQDILVDVAGYPTEAIAARSRAYRPLGLGYANLGGLLMRLGLAYGSKESVARTREVTAALHATALETSAQMAARLGAFAGWGADRAPALAILERHSAGWDEGGWINDTFARALALARATGLRNAQVTLLAPTGTIGLLMDCDTLGIEPEFSLSKIKTLTGGGTLRLVNTGVRLGLEALGYGAQAKEIARFARDRGTVVGAPGLRLEHAGVFDAALPPPDHPHRRVSVEGHLRTMAAAQPFLSGAISKTVNLPGDASVVDVENVFVRGWEMGLKSIALYRDGAKSAQPLCVDC